LKKEQGDILFLGRQVYPANPAAWEQTRIFAGEDMSQTSLAFTVSLTLPVGSFPAAEERLCSAGYAGSF